MITPSYAPTASERVLPRLVLDFTTGVLDSRVTLTRTSATATRVNSSGYVETMAVDTPRFDYNPVTPTICNGLLIEESRQNLQPYSSDFTQSIWTKATGCTIGTNAYIAPSGTTTAQSIAPTNNGNTNGIADESGRIQDGRTLSFFAAPGEITSITGQNGAGQTWTINLSTGAFSGVNAGYSNPTSTAFRDGWRRYSITCTSMSGNNLYIGAASGANGTNKFYLWGVQVEAGTFSTSYIPTTTSSISTRNPDVVSMTGTNFSSWFNATEGATMVQFTDGQDVASLNVLSFEDAAPGANMTLHRESLTYRYRTNLANLNLTGVTALAQNKVAFNYASSHYRASSNGTAIQTNAGSGGPPTVTQLLIGKGSNYAAGRYLNGRVAKIFYWPQRLTDAELQTFST